MAIEFRSKGSGYADTMLQVRHTLAISLSSWWLGGKEVLHAGRPASASITRHPRHIPQVQPLLSCAATAMTTTALLIPLPDQLLLLPLLRLLLLLLPLLLLRPLPLLMQLPLPLLRRRRRLQILPLLLLLLPLLVLLFLLPLLAVVDLTVCHFGTSLVGSRGRRGILNLQEWTTLKKASF